MAGIIGTAFLEQALRGATNSGSMSVSNWYLRLFTNSHTPASTDATSAYTEPTDGSYAAIQLLGGTWTFSVVSAIAKAMYASQVFTFAAGASVVGWYISDSADAIFGGAEAFTGGPVTVPSFGGLLGVAAEIDLQSP